MALAYFLTFTTYGTWLHGSAKGSVDDEHNIHGTPLIEPNTERLCRSRITMAQRPYIMGEAERAIVCGAIVEQAADRGWNLLAAQMRTNHAHVVIAAEADPRRVMSAMKARASRDLTIAGFGNAERRRWTRHGSTLHLFRERDVETKIRYTLDEQGERMAWYEKKKWRKE